MSEMKIIVNNEALAKAVGVKTGEEIAIKCKNGVPVEREWRNRLRDAAVDGCISVVDESGGKPQDKPTQGKNSKPNDQKERK